MKKHSALLAVLLLLMAAIGIWIGKSPRSSDSGNQTPEEKNRAAAHEHKDSSGPEESRAARARRLSPPGWVPPAVFAAKGTPAPQIAFPRGENATRRYHTPQTIELAPSLAMRPPAVLAQSPADGRFDLLPDEIDVHTRLAHRMVFDPSALDSIVRGNTSRLLAPTVDDEVLTLELKTVKSRDANTHTLFGHVVGEESTSDVQLVYHDGIIQGNVARYTSAQEIEYRIMADGHMMVRELDQSTMNAPCGNGPHTECQTMMKDLSEQGITVKPEVESGTVEGDTVGWRQLDVVVGYDPAARVAQGGYSQIEALIIASVDRMSTAFANSVITETEVALLGTIEEPNYVYPGRVSGDMGSGDELGDLDNRTNGALDTISNYATQLGADFTSFVLKDTDGSAGVAYRPGRSSIVARTYMTSTRITFAHELGHNLGCDHSWGDSSQAYHSHYGWRLDVDGLSTTTSDRVRTIMAYDWSWGSGVRIPYFANPDVTYNAAPTGTPNGHDVRTDTRGDQRYLQSGLNFSNGTIGFDGTKTALGANNANTIRTGAGTSTFGVIYASNRATRTDFNVTTPAAGVEWAAGTTNTVFFTGGDEDDLATIQLYKGGVFQMDLATNRNVATGRKFQWSIPLSQALGSDYMIRVSLNRNGSTITADSGTFSIIEQTPMVISQTPASTPATGTPVSQLVLTFNMVMDPASFAVADDVVSFTGPGAINLKPSISSAVWSSGNTVLTLNFPTQTASGSYQLELGSQIQTSTGIPLDQDRDTNPGELTEDHYTASFSILTLADALDATALTWTTNGNANWFPQTATTQDGVDAAQSGVIADNQTSSIQTTLTGPGTLTYYWKVSSENNYDWLEFYINDALQTEAAARISGEKAWAQVSVPIASGAQTVRWTYRKDISINSGSDAAWLDRVVYTPAATVTVAYHGNGNTGGTAPVDPSSPYASGSTVTVLGAGTLTRSGYIFTGWNTQSNGSGTSYAASATFSVTANTTLYAQWAPMPVSVVTSISTVQVPEGSTAGFQVKLSDPPTGDVTVTVARSAGDTNISVSSGSSLIFTTSNWDTYQNVTLAAANDADAANGSATITCTPSNGTYAVANVTATETDKDTTLTATNDGNGSTSPSGAVVVQKNTATAISATPNAGYDFVNWTVTSGSATFGNANSPSTTVTTSQPTTILANFAIRRYTLTYTAGTGGTILGTSPQTVNHGSDGTEVEAVASPGYTFVMWSDNVTAALRTDTAVTANLNVTAQFSANTYTVTFDANGGSAANPVSKVVTFGSAYGTLPSSTRSNYSFDGWFTSITGGEKILAASNVAIADNHTLYARWLPDTYIVSYNGNGSTGGNVPADQNKLHDINLTLASNSGGLTKTGYSFTGWNTAPDGTGTDYPAGSTYSGNTPITLYAKWTLGNDGTWLPTSAGPFNWSDTANWSGGIIASGADRTASFTANITADQTATLDSDRTIGSITFTDTTTSSNNLTISGANTLTLARTSGAPVIDVTQSGRTLTISSNITGTNGLQKNGAGKLILSGTNTFSGGVSINAGSLQISTAAGLGSGSSVTFTGSGILELPSANITLSQGFAISAGVAGSMKNYNATTTINNSLAGSGTLVVQGGGTAGGYVEFTSTSNTFTGNIEISSQSGASYAGGVTFVSLNDSPGSRIKMSNMGIFTYGAGATVPLVFDNRQIENTNIAVLNNNATNVYSTVTVNTNPILSGGVGNRNFTLGGSNLGNNTFAGAITNGSGYTVSLTKANAGNWILSNANNSYTGATTINGGTLSVSKMAHYGVDSNIGKGTAGFGIAFGGGSLNYTGTGDDTDRLVQVSSNNGAILNNGTGALNFTATGNFNVQGSTTSARTLTLGGTHGGTISGAIQNNNTGTIALAKTGSGTWKLDGANTYTGATTVSSGILQFGKISSLYNGTTTSWTAANIRVANGGTLAFNVGGTGEFTSSDIGTLFTNLANSSNATTNGMAAGSRFGFDTTNASGASFTISQVVANSGGTAGGARGLTKLGSGTLVLSNTNTYTGPTTIQAGVLSLTGTTQATTAITFTGGSLGLNTGITVTASSAAVDLANGSIAVTGTTGAASYTLLTAASITGTPTLASPISGYILQVVGGNQLRLVQQTPFQIWAAARGLTGGNADPDADPDGDGLTNLQEFAFATNPSASRPGPIQIDANGKVTSTGLPDIRNFAAAGAAADFRAVFPRRKDHLSAGITYSVEFTADLSRWTASNDGLQVLSTESTGDVDAVSVPFPATVPVTTGGAQQAPKFFRVTVLQN